MRNWCKSIRRGNILLTPSVMHLFHVGKCPPTLPWVLPCQAAAPVGPPPPPRDRLHCSASPGDDGIGAAFYKKFRDLFVPLMFQLCHPSFSRRVPSPRMGNGLINMIPKTAGLAPIPK